jgi:hypothetical protein
MVPDRNEENVNRPLQLADQHVVRIIGPDAVS